MDRWKQDELNSDVAAIGRDAGGGAGEAQARHPESAASPHAGKKARPPRRRGREGPPDPVRWPRRVLVVLVLSCLALVAWVWIEIFRVLH